MRTAVAVAIVIVATCNLAMPRFLRWRTCSPAAPATEPFDDHRWSRCSGPHRIAIGREIAASLVGRSVAGAVVELGQIETVDGRRGWSLGIPDGSPSLYPNETFLEVQIAGEHIVAADVIDL